MKKTIILGIETSCDETAFSLVEASGTLAGRPKFKVLKNLVASQIEIHREFGGVVPNLAKREHLKNLPILFKKLAVEGRMLDAVDLIAVTVGPGLEPALWTGINFAKQIYDLGHKTNDKLKLIGVNHLEGHLYSFLLPHKNVRSKTLDVRQVFPAVALLVSGGHTMLILMKDLKTWKIIGETRDDAVGEAFDKVARMLNLPYPGGPEIQKIAEKGDPLAIEFPRPMIYDKNYDFSFSGLKTSVLYYLRNKNSDANMRIHANYTNINRADIAASFQKAAVDVLVKKTMRAAADFSAKSIVLSGGVAANKKLRDELKKAAKNSGLKFLVAEQKYNTDNAAMIAVAGYMNFLRKKKYPLQANGNLRI